MAFPDPDTLAAIVLQPLLSEAAMSANIAAVMADAEAIKQNYRGGGLFSLYVEGRTTQSDAEKIAAQLTKDGYTVHRYEGQTGYMPPPYMHDFNSADYDTKDVKGTAQYMWTHIQISKTKTA